MKEKRHIIGQLLDDPSFVRWVEGDLNRRQAKRWNRWVQKSEQNRKLAKEAQKRITGFSFGDPVLPDVQSEWKNIYREVASKKEARGIAQKMSNDQNRDPLSMVLKAAAVLLVGAFMGLAAYMYQEPVPEEEPVALRTVQTEYGEKRTINLSDGSTLILAPKSKITYRENWLEKPVKRINLEGEAYFSIASQGTTGQPTFVVNTEDGSASVWGTRFTMDTYGTGTRVVLEEGEVRILSEEAEATEKSATTIQPGQMIRYSKSDNTVELKEVNPRVYTSWSTNELFFDNTPLSVLTNRIERTYGVEVKAEDDELLQKKLSGSVDFRSLEGLTSAVAEVFEIQIHRSGETLIIKQ
ncbi:FecR family protein [Fodinibius roseus]|uniref:FecR family protein n=1 Tax=Fodinibius roseus TaxID=1194090 RepID=A0A1M4W7V4_9BACT|nr:FecR domain-containing protein [Fodinibius roseus]SHE77052.1 FecR family protein [Fodinibius roseus]